MVHLPHFHYYLRTDYNTARVTLVGAKSAKEYTVGLYHDGHYKNSAKDKKSDRRFDEDNVLHMDFLDKTNTNSSDVKPASANISCASSNIGGVGAQIQEQGVRVSDETRPKNMRAMFIIRIE